jgi:hypothetical protein
VVSGSPAVTRWPWEYRDANGNTLAVGPGVDEGTAELQVNGGPVVVCRDAAGLISALALASAPDEAREDAAGIEAVRRAGREAWERHHGQRGGDSA